jgi:hypothetical protein
MNSPNASRPAWNRRKFLKLAAAVGGMAAVGYVLYEYAPWLDYEQQSIQALQPLTQTSDEVINMRELVRFATLAANGHNTQPWKFALKADTVEIHPDLSRRLLVVDPHDRELWMSLGCALENMVLAARAAGYAPQVTYPDAADFIRVRLDKGMPQPSQLFDAIPGLQNTRSEYDGRALDKNELEQINAFALEPGVNLRLLLNPNELNTVVEYVNEGNLQQYADQAFVQELVTWLRFNKKEALASLDGLYAPTSGNPEVPRWLGQMFVTGTNPQEQAKTDAKKLRSSAGAVVIASDTDDKTAWVRTGQVYERLALLLTSLNIKSAFLNQPIEVATVRSQFQSAIGLGTSLPQLLVRFGYANAMPRSLRRPVEQVLFSA